jgi:hypothetical protein
MTAYHAIIYAIINTAPAVTAIVRDRIYPVVMPPLEPGQDPESYIINEFPAITYTKTIAPHLHKGSSHTATHADTITFQIAIHAPASLGETVDVIADAIRLRCRGHENSVIAGHQIGSIHFTGQDHEMFNPDTELITIAQTYNVAVHQT